MVVEVVVIGLSVAGLGYVAWGAINARGTIKARGALGPGRDAARPPPRRERPAPRNISHDHGQDHSMFALSRSVVPAPQPQDPPESVAPRGPLQLDLTIEPEAGEERDVEIVELLSPRDVLSLDLTGDADRHLHLVNGKAEAAIDGRGTVRSAWIDVYMSRADWLGPADLDESGEFPPDFATHMLRVDLGAVRTCENGTTEGALNEAPEIVFDRPVASETRYRA